MLVGGKEMKKTLKRIISLILIASMVLAMPLHALGQGLTDNVDANAEQTQTEQNSSQDVEKTILYELTDKRDSHTKHFLMSDGTMMAAQYENAVHFETQNGWEQYDNSMIVEDETASDENKEYVNKKSDQTVKFAKKAKANKTVTYKYQDYEISWGYQNSEKAELEFINTSTEKSGNDRFLVLDNIAQQAKYAGIFTNVDLELVVSSDGIKENFILNSAVAQNEFVIEYKLKNLTAEQKDKKTIVLKNADGEEVYTLSAPVMYDAQGNASDAICYVITEQKNKKLTVTLTADEEWLKDDSRAYPVTVDPVFSKSSDSENVETRVVYEDTKPYYSSSYLYVSDNYGGFGKTGSIIRFTTLPTLSVGDEIIQAKLNLYQYDITENTEAVIGVSKLTAFPDTYFTSDLSGVKIDGLKYENAVYDYFVESEYANRVKREWDITKAVKDFYTKENELNSIYVHAIKCNQSSYYLRYFKTDGAAQYHPTVFITYCNNVGVESYWNYHDQSVGFGTGYINDYNGNYIYDLPITTQDDIDISLWYNASLSNRLEASSISKGWNFNIDARIIPITADGEYSVIYGTQTKYVYIDEDSTRRYLNEVVNEETNSTEYHDEDGLGYVLTVVDGGYKLAFDEENSYSFNESGRLTKISFGEEIYNIAYTTVGGASVPASVSNSDVNYSFFWDGTLQSVSKNGKTIMSFEYNTENGMLVKATDLQESYTQFSYTNVDGYYYLTNITTNNGDGLTYTYRQGRVNSVTEYGYNGTNGATLSVEYGNDYTTTYTYTRGETSAWETYIFDLKGRTVGVRSSDGSTTDLDYSDEPSSSDNYNTISNITLGNRIAHNLLKNSGFENGTENWSTAVFSDNNVVLSNGDGIFGNSLLATYNSNGSIQGYAQRIAVTPGKYYTFSAYAKTDTTIDYSAYSAGIFLYYEIGGEYIIQPQKELINKKTEGWQRLDYTFTVPESVTYAWVAVGTERVDAVSANIMFDCAMLEEGGAVNDYNLINNSNFRSSDNWKLLVGGTETAFTASNNSVTVQGEYNREKILTQTAVIENCQDETCFELSVIAAANSVYFDPDDESEQRDFGIELIFNYADGTAETYTRSYNFASSSKQTATLAAMPNKDLEIISATVNIRYDFNANSVTVYEVSLIPGGTVIDTESDETETEEDTEETEDTDSKEVYYDDNEEQIKFSYSASTLEGSYYVYDEEGEVTDTYVGYVAVSTDDSGSETVSFDMNRPYMHTSTSSVDNLDENGKVISYTVTSVDEYGNSTSATYDKETDNILSSTDAKGVTTTYSYNAQDLLVAVMCADSSLAYAYDSKDYLSSITHNGFNYNLNYDEWGNLTSVSIGDKIIVTYSYFPGTSIQSEMTYSNGATLTCVYDEFDRPVKIYSNGSLLAEYVYNNKNMLFKTVDWSSGSAVETKYYYDASGNVSSYKLGDLYVNLTSSETASEAHYYFGDSFILTTKSVIDENDNNTYYFGGIKNNSGTTLLNSLTTSQDDFDRITAQNIVTSSGVSLTAKAYNYKSVGNATGNLVEIYTSFGVSYNYTYDANGNIASETSNGQTDNYFYDSLGQLVRVNSQKQNKTILYSYDNSGNMTQKKEYAYTTAEQLPSVTETTVDDTSELITYSGTWESVDSWYCSGHSLFRTRDAAASCTFSFTGTGLTLLTYKSPTRGSMLVSIDGAPAVEYNCYDEEYDNYKIPIYVAENVDSVSQHTVTITPKADNGNLWIDIDAFIVINDPNVVSTTVEETAEGITYSGIWNTVDSWYCSGHSLKRTRDASASCTFTFTGTGLTLLTYKSTTRGTMCVSVDGGEVVEYDCSSDTTDVEFKIPLLVSNGFATSTEHTVTITPKSDNGNLWIDVDAFIVVNGATTYTYTYGDSEWKDLLTNYNGEDITYDAIGNPLNYRNGMVFSWVNGRSLSTINASELSAIFEYNASGIRTKKTVNGVTTEYILDEQGTLIGEICGEDRIIYYYDEQGSPIGFCLNGTADYYFGTNLVGDITAIYDANGTFVAGYSYNEFGILLEITGDEAIANLNHLRFKGYYYDTETGLYYLQSRYYDPVIGRFINADDTVFLGASGTTLGCNLFAYCESNGINLVDDSGYSCDLVQIALTIFGYSFTAFRNSNVPAYYYLISQYVKSSYYRKNDWKYKRNRKDYIASSNDGCSSASISMALRTLGSDITPGTIFVKNGYKNYVKKWSAFGYKFQNVPPSSKSNTSQLKAKLNQYLSNPFKYAPPIVDIVKGDKCHFIVVIGYGDNGKFLVLDPGYTKVYRKQKISYIGKIVQYYK